MNTLLDTEESQDTEITLSTASLLAIFFGLVVVCGVFFGFGYSMGRRTPGTTTPTTTAADANSAEETAVAHALARKPSAQADPDRDTDVQEPARAADDSSGMQTVTVPTTNTADTPDAALVPAPEPRPREAAPAPRPLLVKPAKPAAAVVHPALASTSPAAPLSGSGPASIMVQIAAVSRVEDADVLVAALRKRGYSVLVRREPQDALAHVQVGPFTSRADANTMRQKLLADGYNAIVKP